MVVSFCTLKENYFSVRLIDVFEFIYKVYHFNAVMILRLGDF